VESVRPDVRRADPPKAGSGDAAVAAAVHASVHNLFNQELHLTDRQTYKQRRSEAFCEWRSVLA
jgi:hypothetical protein